MLFFAADNKCPKKPKTFFPKTRNPVLGTSDGRISLCCTPQKTQNLFSENKKPRFGDIRWPYFALLHPPKNPKPFFRKQETPFLGHPRAYLHPFAPILQSWSQFCENDFQNYETINALAKMAPKKFRNLPSAARFCAKRFRHIDFWTFFLSIF